jgi:hypothetical protein
MKRHSEGGITEAQLGAFLMAVFQRGLSTLRETADLTTAMRFSGEVFDTEAPQTPSPSTSTPPAASATRPRSSSRPLSPPRASKHPPASPSQ